MDRPLLRDEVLRLAIAVVLHMPTATELDFAAREAEIIQVAMGPTRDVSVLVMVPPPTWVTAPIAATFNFAGDEWAAACRRAIFEFNRSA